MGAASLVFRVVFCLGWLGWLCESFAEGGLGEGEGL
jgi:hypothetical protein